MAETTEVDHPELEKIQLNVRNGAGELVSFRVTKRTKLIKVFNAYGDKMSLKPGSFRLVTVDGQNVNTQKTVSDLGFEDNEVLDVLATQVGGSF